MSDSYFEIRKAKLDSYAEKYPPKYPSRFHKTHFCGELAALSDGTSGIGCAGRIMGLRVMGKLAFGVLQDHTGRAQFALEANKLTPGEFQFLIKHLDLGDIVGITGEMFTSKKGERTLSALSCRLLAKGLRPLPEKWHGLADQEACARQRYLDLIVNEETRKRFRIRSKVIRKIRTFLEEADFLEVETPILQQAACGASARPFVTHHNALDIPLYMRIAPETYLKRLVVGGYERVFEIGRCFRNEGIDASHLQEFTSVEWYAAYWNFEDNMKFVMNLIQETVQEISGDMKIIYDGAEIDFSGQWPIITYRDLIFRDTGVDLDLFRDAESLREELKRKDIRIDLDSKAGYGKVVDCLYKQYSRPKLIQPCFLTMHPQDLVPLARRNDLDSGKLDMFQVLVNGWELVKAYSELVDPIEQRERLAGQKKLADDGDDEVMMLEEDFILCMEHGMPPMSGLGLGIDRFVALLSGAKNIRDIVFFPSMRPLPP
ncbi:MAG: lysine--tRNA ligase [Oligoflexales bacterium]|nr:lysine--tRNA ligase [Oligoflexales bacterium]